MSPQELVCGTAFDQCHRPEHAGGQRLQVVHVLRYEADAVTGVEQPVIGEGMARECIDGGVANDDFDLVRACVNEGCDVDLIRRMPDVSGGLAVDENLGGVAYGAFKIRAHIGGA